MLMVSCTEQKRGDAKVPPPIDHGNSRHPCKAVLSTKRIPSFLKLQWPVQVSTYSAAVSLLLIYMLESTTEYSRSPVQGDGKHLRRHSFLTNSAGSFS
jgi:hypothetical protein